MWRHSSKPAELRCPSGRTTPRPRVRRNLSPPEKLRALSTGKTSADRARRSRIAVAFLPRSEEHTSELQSQSNLVCRLLLEKKNTRAATTAQPHKPALTTA